MHPKEKYEYRFFRWILYVYCLSGVCIAIGILGFVVSYLPLIVTGDEDNIFSALIQLLAMGFMVIGIGVTGFTTTMSASVPQDHEKRLGWYHSIAIVLGVVVSIFKPQINRLFQFQHTTLFAGTFLFLVQVLILALLLSHVARTFECHSLDRKSKRVIPWLIATWLFPAIFLTITVASSADSINCLLYTSPSPRD